MGHRHPKDEPCAVARPARVRRVALRRDECQVGRLGLGGLSPPYLEELDAVAVAFVDDGVRCVVVDEAVSQAAHELAQLLVDLVRGSKQCSSCFALSERPCWSE